MKIGVISDTHDRIEALKKIAEIFSQEKVERIVHCGDWVSPYMLLYFNEVFKERPVPVDSLIGNNPGDLEAQEEVNSSISNPIYFEKKTINLNIGGRRILVIHGDNREELQKSIDSGDYDAIFTGHTHSLRNENIGKTLVLNPGSTAFAIGGKVVDEASVAVYDSDTNSARIIEFSKKDV